MKKYRFLFMIVFAIFVMLPLSVNAGDEIHANVQIEGTTDIVPMIGRTPQYLTIYSDEHEIVSQQWMDANDNPITTFEEGKKYYYRLILKHKTASGWDNTSTLNVTNIDWLSTSSELGSDHSLLFNGMIEAVQGYEIKIESDEGVLIGQNGPLVGPKGFDRKLAILPEEGYEITSVKVNDVEQTLPLEKDELAFSNIQEDIIVVVESEKDEGDPKQINLFESSINQEYIKGSDKTLAFTLNNNRGYGKVFIDGVELNESVGDYSWLFAENLPHIVLSKDYLTTLKSGKYTIKIVIDNVGEAETTFTIVESTEGSPKRVTFDANGGTFKDASKILSFDSWYYSDLDSLETPTREDYNFKGWHTQAESGTPLTAEPTLTDGMTFYAHWEKIVTEPEEEIPETFDGIGSSILIGTISLIGLVGTTIYLKRRNKIRTN